MASLSALGSFGAALEIILILYPLFVCNSITVRINYFNGILFMENQICWLVSVYIYITIP